MLRKLAGGAAVGALAYGAGIVVGYRAAAVDFVENDAETLQRLAEHMYDLQPVTELSADDLTDEELESLPAEVQEAITDNADDDETDDTGHRAFQ